ncbi:MAG: ADP-ribosylglycohydrolase family protein [Chloroflexota bacterium]|nr:ADP-ribosylglycohydrolase family protein [Chloroflexota bacterium]
MPPTPSLIDRARGCIVGLACGDALGAPVEFDSRAAIRSRYPDGLRDFTSGGWMNVVPGELTDDSRMMLDLADAIVQPGGLDMDDLGRRFVAWMDEEPKDIGNTTRLAIQLLKSGVPWDEAGARALRERGPSGAASNGSVMRCAPVALRWYSDPEGLRQVSIDTSRITHAEERCIWSCVAVNQAIAYLLNDGSREAVLEATIRNVPQGEVVAAVESAASASAAELNGRGYVLNAVLIGFWALLTTESFEDAVVAAVMIGDDTDTNAAVAGALAGAHYGYYGIPERWRIGVHQHDRLVALADQLVSASVD